MDNDLSFVNAEGETIRVPDFSLDYPRAERERTDNFRAAVGKAELMRGGILHQFEKEYPDYHKQFEALVAIGTATLLREDMEAEQARNKSFLKRIFDFS